MNYLYWIYKEGDTDPYSEGYIGVTNNMAKRLEAHLSGGGSSIVLEKSKKYDLKIDILYQSSCRSNVEFMEEQYRPAKRIGWNIAPGGGLPPIQTGAKFPSANHGMRNKVHTEETKQKMSKTRTGKKKSASHAAAIGKANRKGIIYKGVKYSSITECVKDGYNNKKIYNALKLGTARYVLRKIINS